VSDPGADDARRWRSIERARLLAQRQGIEARERERRDARLVANLDALLRAPAPLARQGERVIGAFWPIRAEPDLRRWLQTRHQRGDRCALPVVAVREAPLAFRLWTPGCRMATGAFDTQVPADDLPVTPNIVIMPLVAFDRACYRLGYGGGYYDRTLATLSPAPLKIGVGYAQFALATIHPQPFDIPMDCVVTEQGIVEPR
jgi:5,10-methenyltetrahydrofolate synthetase